MTPCRYPGCVSEAKTDGLCPVHEKPTGSRMCDTCHGTGSHFYSGQNLTMACQRCGGTGFKDAKTSKVVPKRERVPVDQRGLIQKIEE